MMPQPVNIDQFPAQAAVVLALINEDSPVMKEKLNEMPASGQGSLSEHSEMALIHIVLSHHGVLEFGAAKVPSTPEAIFVANLDDLDAKTQMGITAARDGNDDEESVHRGPMTDKIWALNTRLYKPDPLAGD